MRPKIKDYSELSLLPEIFTVWQTAFFVDHGCTRNVDSTKVNSEQEVQAQR